MWTACRIVALVGSVVICSISSCNGFPILDVGRLFLTRSSLHDRAVYLAVQTVENVLKNESYDDVKVAQWVNDICEASIEKLAALKKPFKYAGKRL